MNYVRCIREPCLLPLLDSTKPAICFASKYSGKNKSESEIHPAASMCKIQRTIPFMGLVTNQSNFGMHQLLKTQLIHNFLTTTFVQIVSTKSRIFQNTIVKKPNGCPDYFTSSMIYLEWVGNWSGTCFLNLIVQPIIYIDTLRSIVQSPISLFCC